MSELTERARKLLDFTERYGTCGFVDVAKPLLADLTAAMERVEKLAEVLIVQGSLTGRDIYDALEGK